MIDRKILARIKKCLALSSSANEHEASAALAKAKEMMDTYGISDEELQLADVSMETTRRATSARRPPAWEVRLIHLISGTFAVEPVIDGQNVCFAGLNSRPVIATYAFAMVRRIIKRRRSDYLAKELRRCKLAIKRARADHFCTGFVRGIEVEIICMIDHQECALAKAFVEQSFALDSVKPRAASTTRSRAVGDDYHRGFEEGSKVKLHRGLEGEAASDPVFTLEARS